MGVGAIPMPVLARLWNTSAPSCQIVSVSGAPSRAMA
jgi:hypothetical protein